MTEFFQTRDFYFQKFPNTIQQLEIINELLQESYQEGFKEIQEFFNQIDENEDYEIEYNQFIDYDDDDEIECNEELNNENYIEHLISEDDIDNENDENCPPEFLQQFYISQLNSIQTQQPFDQDKYLNQLSEQLNNTQQPRKSKIKKFAKINSKAQLKTVTTLTSPSKEGSISTNVSLNFQNYDKKKSRRQRNKEKKQLKKVDQEIKQFKKLLEMDLIHKNSEKLKPNISEDWLNKVKQKYINKNLKNLIEDFNSTN